MLRAFPGLIFDSSMQIHLGAEGKDERVKNLKDKTKNLIKYVSNQKVVLFSTEINRIDINLQAPVKKSTTFD